MELAKVEQPAEIQQQSAAEMRAKIVRLEAVVLSFPQIEIKTTHHFAPGIYMREVFIPKDAIITGAIHKTEHMNILSQGELSVMTDGGMKRLKASTVIKSQPGIKRVAYAHEDSVWITVHPNVSDERDVEKLKANLVTNTFEEFLEYQTQNEPKLLDHGGK